MIPDPLHPAVVHFPIVFTILLPLVAIGTLVAIGRGARPATTWAITLALSLALTFSAWAAVETGEREEERVEQAVAEAALHSHEEAAERFLVLSGIVAVITAAGFLRGAPGRAARFGTVVGAAGLAVAGALVGHSGGNLVYRDGAASAYTSTAGPMASNEADQDDDR